MSDQSDLLTAVSEDSPVNPEEALFLWRAVLFSPVPLSTPLDDVAKMAVKALRDGLRTAWTDAHSELFREVLCNLTECLTDDFDEHGKIVKNGCILCAKRADRFDLIESCGLHDLCREVIISERASLSSVYLAIASLPRLNERGSTDSGACVRMHALCNDDCTNRVVLIFRFAWTEIEDTSSGAFRPNQSLEASTIWHQVKEGAAKGLVLEVVSALLQNEDGWIRSAMLHFSEFLLDFAPFEEVCKREEFAAYVAPLAARALSDENAFVRFDGATLSQVILEKHVAAYTPECFATAISGALRHVRDHPDLLDILSRMAAAAPEGIVKDAYEGAVGRLRQVEDGSHSQEKVTAAFFGVFMAARLAGDSCKDDFIQQFINFLNRPEQVKMDVAAEPDDCYACYESKAVVVLRKGCDRFDCGGCACSRAHFCAPCTARIFLAFPNPFQVTCQMCRRVVCLDDVRLLKSSDCDAEKNTR